jgi:hypothetical protein
MATPTRFPIMPGHRSSSTQCTLLIKHNPDYGMSRVETKIHFSFFAKKMFRRFRENKYFPENVRETNIFRFASFQPWGRAHSLHSTQQYNHAFFIGCIRP